MVPMQTLLLYLLIMAVIVAVVFAIVWFVFGRGEPLPPLDGATTLTELPRHQITSDDVAALRFTQVVRGYKQSEVDWALRRLGTEVDELHELVRVLSERDQANSAAASTAPSRPAHRPPNGGSDGRPG